MSDVVGRTLAALPKLFGDNLIGSAQGPQIPKNIPGLGPSFQKFVRLLHKTKNKYEEEQFIKTQLADMKEQVNNPKTSKDRIIDLLFQCVYCRMLGYRDDFSSIECLKLLAVIDMTHMKMGFVTTNLLIEKTDETALLAICSITKHLKSPNLLEVFQAIPTAAHLSIPPIIECLLPFVQDITTHRRELVRAKAVMVIYIYFLNVPELFRFEEDKFYKSLCDPDPSVMAATCHIFHHLVQKDRTKYTNLVPILVNILQQITDRKLPTSFEYHSIPLPWLQIKILKILALLGADNQRDSQIMYPVLQAVFERIGMKQKMAFAICYECIMTCTSIYPNQELLKTAAQSVGNFLRSKDIPLKYIGIKSLTGLVKVSQEFALQYQTMVVELLDDPDETIRRKTLVLLYNMTNCVNVQPVCDKLLEHMVNSNDSFHKEDLLHKIIELIYKYFKPEVWVVDVLFKVLQICPSSSSGKVMKKVISALKKGNSMTENREFCQHMVKKAVECLFRKDLLADVTKLAAWIIGQQSGFLKNMPKDKLMALFTNQLSRQHIDDMTKLWLVTALVNLVQTNVLETDVLEEPIIKLIKSENSLLLQEKLGEVLRISQTKLTTETKTVKVDFTLSFLDNYVSESLMAGACPYKPKYMRYKQTSQEQDVTELFKGIQNQETEKPGVSTRPCDDVTNSDHTSLTTSDSVSRLPTSRKVWGREGRISDRTDADQSSQEVREGQISEEDQNRKQLISALFGGIASGKDEKMEEDVPDPFFTEDDNYDVKNVVDTGGWRQLHQSSADINSSKLKKQTVSLQNSDIFMQDENQSSQNVMGDIFDGNHPYSKHQNDGDSIEKQFNDSDLLTQSGAEGGSNLYDDFLDADDKQQNQTSKLGTGTTDTSKSLYDEELS